MAPIVFVVATTENSIKIQWRSSDTKSAISGLIKSLLFLKILDYYTSTFSIK